MMQIIRNPLARAALSAQRKAAHMKRCTMMVDGRRWAYLDGGRGRAIIMLHGFGADKDNWALLGQRLTRHYRVIAPDLPGFGETERKSDDDYSMGAQAEHVRAFASALGLECVDLAGNSMGGNIAGTYAGRYPEAVRSLLLVSPQGVGSGNASELEDVLLNGGDNPLVVRSQAEYSELMGWVFFKRPFMPGFVRAYLADQSIANADRAEGIFDHLVETVDALNTILKGSSVPTLIVWGEQDRILHVSGASVLAGLMADAQVEVLPRVGHAAMIEAPQETARLYENLLRRTGDRQ